MQTILLADAEAELRTLVRITLADPQRRILEADNGSEALALARRERPDLVMLDWTLPGLTGVEVARALRDDAATAEVPIIMLTARGQEIDRSRTHDLGAFAYLAKPFSALALLEAVREITHQTGELAESLLATRTARDTRSRPVPTPDDDRLRLYAEWLARGEVWSRETTDLTALVVRFGREVPALAALEVDCSLLLPGAPCRVRAREDDLALVVGALLENAVKFSPGRKTVRVRLESRDDGARLEVRDLGEGFPPERGRELFRPFVGGDEHRAHGTGLSLALARAIVQAHGGHITAESAGPGTGATFRVVLPRLIAET